MDRSRRGASQEARGLPFYYLDYYAEPRGNKFIEVRYRVFAKERTPSDNEVDQSVRLSLDANKLEPRKRLFVKGFFPTECRPFELVTDLSVVYNLTGTVESLSKHRMKVRSQEKQVLILPSYNIEAYHVNQEVRVAMNVNFESIGVNIGGQLSSVTNAIASSHSQLRPIYLMSDSPTPGGDAEINESKERKIRRLFIFQDPAFIASLDKYPSTIGKERLIIQSLTQLFPNLEQWRNQVRELEEKFSSWRKSRGDGNCYYRAVAVSYLEAMLRNRKLGELSQFYLKLLNQESYQVERGFEDHHYYFIQQLGNFLRNASNSPNLVKDFQALLFDDAFDSAMTGVFRNLAADWLRTNAGHDEIFPFILDSGIEPVVRDILKDETEGEGLVFVGMANVLNAKVNHIIMNQNEAATHTESFAPFPKVPIEAPYVEVSLLLRPGHYDLIYEIQGDAEDRYDSGEQAFV